MPRASDQRGIVVLVADVSDAAMVIELGLVPPNRFPTPDSLPSVVKVIVPGLRHFWPRYAPGRLYDTPVKLGWLPAPIREDDLNPIAIFI